MCQKTDVVVVAKKKTFDKSILFTHKYIRVYSLKFTIDYVSIIKIIRFIDNNKFSF